MRELNRNSAHGLEQPSDPRHKVVDVGHMGQHIIGHHQIGLLQLRARGGGNVEELRAIVAAAPGDLESRWDLANALAAGGDYEPALGELVLAGGVAPATQLLAISLAHLDGEIAAAEGRTGDAVVALGRAAHRLRDMAP